MSRHQFLEQKYGHALALEVVEPLTLEAHLATVDGRSLDAPATLRVTPDGQAWLTLDSPVPRSLLADAAAAKPPTELSVTGTSADGRTVRADRVLVENYALPRRPDGGLTYVPHEPPAETCTLLVAGDVTVESGIVDPDRFYAVRYLLTNALFDGTDIVESPEWSGFFRG